MGVQKFPNAKDPGEDLDYRLNWASVLPSGDTIVSSTWTVPTGLTGHSQAFSTTTTTIWLSGGTVNVNYTLTNVVTTAAGRTFERDVILKVKNL